MILKKLTVKNFGPFRLESTLEFEPDVTVLTGANDAGKSMALRTIEILCSKSTMLKEEVNRHRVREFRGDWANDGEILCQATFAVTDVPGSRRGLGRSVSPGMDVMVRRRLNEAEGMIVEAQRGDTRVAPNVPFISFPLVVRLPLVSEVRQDIPLQEMNEAEEELLRLGFGPGFTTDEFAKLDVEERTRRIDEAEETLNERLLQLLPPSMALSFRIAATEEKPGQLSVSIVDKHKSYVSLASHGAGVRRLINVMGAVLRIHERSEHTLVLYDEPETSLHADAQHSLRRLLEQIGSLPTVQIVYTTHSPAMINTQRPMSVRVIQQRQVDGKATAFVTPRTFYENFSGVRTSLGITAADSLLYAPITILVEGPTELLCIPLVLEKLADSGVIKGDVLRPLLGMTHLVHGNGSEVERMCRIAKSQQAHPIVFLDGDNSKVASQVRGNHDDVPVIELEHKKEFEDIVDPQFYIRAAAELGGVQGDDPQEAFEAWVKENPREAKGMLSKRVATWLESSVGKAPSKVDRMARAISLADGAIIAPEPFVRLFEEMVRIGRRL